MRNFILIIIFVVFTFSNVFATYIQEELFVIEWGEENSQLKLDPPYYSPPDTFPGYVTDGEMSAGSGPDDVFVDRDENFIFSSYDFGQLKGFNSVGDLIFNFSSGETQYDPEIHQGQPQEIYIDSLFRIYVMNFPGWNFIPIIDYQGNILEKINPFAPDTNIRITSMYWKFDGTISFFSREYRWYTKRGDEITPGGTSCFLAANGSYYAAIAQPPDTIKFNKFENPDETGLAETREYTEIYPTEDSLSTTFILPGGDGTKLFVLKRMDYLGNEEIWEFDLEYNLLDRIKLECWTEEAVWNLTPFIGHDGSVYEFRCFEDGLHVIRWRKE